MLRKLHLGAKLLASAMTITKMGQLNEKLDVFQALARQLLKSEKVQKLADGFLDAVKPDN